MTLKRFARIVAPFLAMALYSPAVHAQAAKPASKPAPNVGGAAPNLLGQYGDWGAYTAAPGGKKVCFAISRPTKTLPTNVRRDPSYMFISTRPAEKVTEEVSVILGYPTKSSVDGAVEIADQSFVMYTQNDGAWVKNAPDEPKLVTALRGGAEAVVKAESTRGTKTTDTYSLKGVTQALDRAAQECK
jgi:invasion protein IalB